jgi:hypothetical protein
MNVPGAGVSRVMMMMVVVMKALRPVLWVHNVIEENQSVLTLFNWIVRFP